ncbi:MAG: GrdX family protein [Lutisporaceae bacterium]
MKNCEEIKLNKNILVISNNPDVYEVYCSSFNIELIDGNYYNVLTKVRDYVHQGYDLITHPLMGSVKPNETPYRSIILKKGKAMDLQSLEIIENSITTYKKFEKIKPTPCWSPKVLEDFQVVDKRLFESSLDNIILYT